MHPRARTTPEIRVQIATSIESAAALASRYGVSTETIRKWRRRGATDCLDRSSRPLRLRWRATELERRAVGDLRRVTRLPLDEFVALARACFPHLNRDSVYRVLRTSGLARLPGVDAAEGAERRGVGSSLLVDGAKLPRVTTADGEIRDRQMLSAFDPISRALHVAFATGTDGDELTRFVEDAANAMGFSSGRLLVVHDAAIVEGCRQACARLGFGFACVSDWWPDRRGVATPRADDVVLRVAVKDQESLTRLIDSAVAHYNSRPLRGLGGRAPAMLVDRREPTDVTRVPADRSAMVGRRPVTLVPGLRGAA